MPHTHSPFVHGCVESPIWKPSMRPMTVLARKDFPVRCGPAMATTERGNSERDAKKASPSSVIRKTGPFAGSLTISMSSLGALLNILQFGEFAEPR